MDILELNILGCGSAKSTLQHLPSCQVLNVRGGSKNQGTLLEIYASDNKAKQKFEFDDLAQIAECADISLKEARALAEEAEKNSLE